MLNLFQNVPVLGDKNDLEKKQCRISGLSFQVVVDGV